MFLFILVSMSIEELSGLQFIQDKELESKSITCETKEDSSFSCKGRSKVQSHKIALSAPLSVGVTVH